MDLSPCQLLSKAKQQKHSKKNYSADYFVFNGQYSPTAKSSGTDVTFRMTKKLNEILIFLSTNGLFVFFSII